MEQIQSTNKPDVATSQFHYTSNKSQLSLQPTNPVTTGQQRYSDQARIECLTSSEKPFPVPAKSIAQKELSEKELENNLFDLQLALLESDVAQEVIDDLVAELKNELLGLQLERGIDAEEIIRSKLQEYSRNV